MKPLFALSLLSLLGCSCLGGKMPDGIPDHQEISSGGYHAWPAKALREGINTINGRLQEIVSAAKEDDILGHDNHDNRRP